MDYDRTKALEYAHKWAYGRNPAYFSFDGMGGDCTNFVSQCLYAGCGVMNNAKDTGWYYKSLNDRAAAWSGVEYLYSFLTSNTGPGPYGTEARMDEAETGDVIQLSYDGKRYGHSLFVVSLWPEPLVAQHSSQNYDNRAFSTYACRAARLIHIEGARR